MDYHKFIFAVENLDFLIKSYDFWIYFHFGVAEKMNPFVFECGTWKFEGKV